MPGAYLHADIPKGKIVILRLRGDFVAILCELNLENLYLCVVRAIYGCMESRIFARTNWLVDYQLISLLRKHPHIMLNMCVRPWRFHNILFMRRVAWATFSGFIHKNKRFPIIRRGTLATLQNCDNWKNWQNTMPKTVRLWPGNWAKASAISWMLRPSTLIRDKYPNTWLRERVEVLVVVRQYFRVVRRGSPTTDAFIMRHEDFPNKELYAINRIVHITEEGPE